MGLGEKILSKLGVGEDTEYADSKNLPLELQKLVNEGKITKEEAIEKAAILNRQSAGGYNSTFGDKVHDSERHHPDGTVRSKETTIHGPEGTVRAKETTFHGDEARTHGSAGIVGKDSLDLSAREHGFRTQDSTGATGIHSTDHASRSHGSAGIAGTGLNATEHEHRSHGSTNAGTTGLHHESRTHGSTENASTTGLYSTDLDSRTHGSGITGAGVHSNDHDSRTHGSDSRTHGSTGISGTSGLHSNDNSATVISTTGNAHAVSIPSGTLSTAKPSNQTTAETPAGVAGQAAAQLGHQQSTSGLKTSVGTEHHSASNTSSERHTGTHQGGVTGTHQTSSRVGGSESNDSYDKESKTSKLADKVASVVPGVHSENTRGDITHAGDRNTHSGNAYSNDSAYPGTNHTLNKDSREPGLVQKAAAAIPGVHLSDSGRSASDNTHSGDRNKSALSGNAYSNDPIYAGSNHTHSGVTGAAHSGFTGDTHSGAAGNTHSGIAGTHSGVTGTTHSGVTGNTHSGITGNTHSGITGNTHSGTTGNTHSGNTYSNDPAYSGTTLNKDSREPGLVQKAAAAIPGVHLSDSSRNQSDNTYSGDRTTHSGNAYSNDSAYRDNSNKESKTAKVADKVASVVPGVHSETSRSGNHADSSTHGQSHQSKDIYNSGSAGNHTNQSAYGTTGTDHQKDVYNSGNIIHPGAFEQHTRGTGHGNLEAGVDKITTGLAGIHTSHGANSNHSHQTTGAYGSSTTESPFNRGADAHTSSHTTTIPGAHSTSAGVFTTGNTELDSKFSKLDPKIQAHAKEAYNAGYRDAQKAYKA